MKEINYKEIKFNPFNLIGGEWMLVTAGNKQSGCNTMTARRCMHQSFRKVVSFIRTPSMSTIHSVTSIPCTSERLRRYWYAMMSI